VRARLTVALIAIAGFAGCGDDSASAPAGAPEPFRAQVRTAHADGTRIAWYERGAGEPLVMLMGTGSTMAEWDPALLRLLAADHRLIMFDYPGVGRSGPWRGESFDSLAATTSRFMAAIGVERADVLGWSMGGFVAQRLAIEHPERVGGLVLAGTNPGGRMADLGTPEQQRIDSDPDPSNADILHELYPPGRQAEGRRFLARLRRASQTGEIPDDFDVPAATTDAQVAAEDPWLRSDRNYRELATIEAATLATGGRADPVVPPPNLRRIAAQVPGGELALFDGAHAFLFQERQAFADRVAAFLGG